MKKHAFTIMILAATLLLCGAAWFVKNRAWLPWVVGADAPVQEGTVADDPLEGFETFAPPGPVWDGMLGQWSLREASLLRGEIGTLVRAPTGGTVRECRREGGAWSVLIVRDDGGSLRLGGLQDGLVTGRRVEAGEIIGRLAGDTLSLEECR